MNTKALSLIGMSFAIAALAHANAITFKVGAGSPAAQLAQVESDADFENFTGRTGGVTGTIVFDPAKRTGSTKLSIDAANIDTGIPLRNDHMKSAGWLDVEKNPKITFESTKIKFVRGDQYDVTGNFTLKGVTKLITVRATVKHLKESAQTKGAGFKGDVLQVRTSFNIKLSDYNIKIPNQAAGKVAPVVKITLTAYGMSGS